MEKEIDALVHAMHIKENEVQDSSSVENIQQLGILYNQLSDLNDRIAARKDKMYWQGYLHAMTKLRLQ